MVVAVHSADLDVIFVLHNKLTFFDEAILYNDNLT